MMKFKCGLWRNWVCFSGLWRRCRRRRWRRCLCVRGPRGGFRILWMTFIFTVRPSVQYRSLIGSILLSRNQSEWSQP